MSTALNELFNSGKARRFSGPSLHEIAFPLGGIGTGTVCLGGRGQLRDWELFNRPSKGFEFPFTWATVWAQEEGREPVTRIAEARLLPPFSTSHGLPPSQGAGLPRLEHAVFTGVYPFARVQLYDPALPVEITLTAFNPLIPLDPDDSGLPVAILRYRLRNHSGRPVSATISFSLINIVGVDGSPSPGGLGAPYFGGNLNEWVDEGTLRGLQMTSSRYEPDAPQYGSLALTTSWPDCSYRTNCLVPNGHWPWDSTLVYWDDLSADGRIQDDYPCRPSDESKTHLGALALSANLEPGESAELPFLLAWHFPNRTVKGCGWGPEEDHLGNYYATRFLDAWAAAVYTTERLAELEEKSARYARSMLLSTLPDFVLDAAMANSSTLRTQTCMRTADGAFHGFEGCSPQSGCCAGTCTHVWNYEQTTAFLFPSLSRSIRNTEFLNNTDENGLMSFRTKLPLGTGAWGKAAADGQMGAIMRLYRDWKLCGDDAWLRGLWPAAKRALEFAWIEGGWDADRDGVMEGVQHNTFDVEYHGPTPQTGFFYLGALRAGEEMARAVGDSASADAYHALWERGSRWWDEHLFNGEYYYQQVQSQVGKPVAEGLSIGMGAEILAEPLYQLGPGCLSDQLLGQYMASVAGLGYLSDPDHIRQALASVYRYNFKPDLRAHVNAMRGYAANEEGGLLICSWPHGGRPPIPTPYADEAWTGIEYIAATSLIYEGMVEEGLQVIATARARHDGERRNPWDEPECGHHYARAMSAWGPLLALSGFQYSAPDAALSFAPRVSADDFRCFWSGPGAWGSFGQRVSGGGIEAWLAVEYGELALRSLTLSVPAPAQAQVFTGGEELGCALEPGEETVTLRLNETVKLREGETLRVVGRE